MFGSSPILLKTDYLTLDPETSQWASIRFFKGGLSRDIHLPQGVFAANL
jgi:hypothetical protein